MNVLKALFSKYFTGGERRGWLPVNQNGRGPIAVSDAQLLKARDDLIRRQCRGAGQAERATAIRANWPPEKLFRDCAEAYSNGKVLTLGARTGFLGWLMPRSREIDLRHDADDSALGATVIEALA